MDMQLLEFNGWVITIDAGDNRESYAYSHEDNEDLSGTGDSISDCVEQIINDHYTPNF